LRYRGFVFLLCLSLRLHFDCVNILIYLIYEKEDGTFRKSILAL